MDTVHVHLGPRSYPITLTTAGDAGLGPFVRSCLPDSTRALVVCDANTADHGRRVEAALREVGFTTGIATVPAGEGSKSLAELSKLYDALYDLTADRKTAVVAVGGGGGRRPRRVRRGDVQPRAAARHGPHVHCWRWSIRRSAGRPG